MEWKNFYFTRQRFYLSNEMLQKLDRMTMAASVEGRVPFASHQSSIWLSN